jgi:hypothetical protein
MSKTSRATSPTTSNELKRPGCLPRRCTPADDTFFLHPGHWCLKIR